MSDEERERERDREREEDDNNSGSDSDGSDDDNEDFIVFVKEVEAVAIIGGDEASGLSDLATRITAKIRTMGFNIDEEIEILVPKMSADGKHRKMMFVNVPRAHRGLALLELFAEVTHCTDDQGVLLKDADSVDAPPKFLNKKEIFKNDDMTEDQMNSVIANASTKASLAAAAAGALAGEGDVAMGDAGKDGKGGKDAWGKGKDGFGWDENWDPQADVYSGAGGWDNSGFGAD